MKNQLDISPLASSGSSPGRLQELLQSIGQQPLSPAELLAMGDHLALLLRWNARINLTAIRDEESILRRHFVESIVCARLLPAGIRTMLDFGSGGGFPGIPCSICRPEVHVTLAESQGRKAAFLRESIRLLKLGATVYQGRVESLEPGILFDGVTLRAVERMRQACGEAVLHVKKGGWLAVLATVDTASSLAGSVDGISWNAAQPIAGSEQHVLLLGSRLAD